MSSLDQSAGRGGSPTPRGDRAEIPPTLHPSRRRPPVRHVPHRGHGGCHGRSRRPVPLRRAHHHPDHARVPDRHREAAVPDQHSPRRPYGAGHHEHDAIGFQGAGAAAGATDVRAATWSHGVLTLRVGTSDASATLGVTLTPSSDRYRVESTVEGTAATSTGMHFAMGSAGHWYGHGEATTGAGGPYTDQPWPLDSGKVADDAFGPGVVPDGRPVLVHPVGGGHLVRHSGADEGLARQGHRRRRGNGGHRFPEPRRDDLRREDAQGRLRRLHRHHGQARQE